jgi:hypothetical protein
MWNSFDPSRNNISSMKNPPGNIRKSRVVALVDGAHQGYVITKLIIREYQKTEPLQLDALLSRLMHLTSLEIHKVNLMESTYFGHSEEFKQLKQLSLVSCTVSYPQNILNGSIALVSLYISRYNTFSIIYIYVLTPRIAGFTV